MATRSRDHLQVMLSILTMTALLAACGSAASQGGSTGPGPTGVDGSLGATAPLDTTATGSTGATPAASTSVPVTGHLGDKLTFAEFGSGDAVDATLVKLFDPAAPNDGSEAPLPTASHWVGVEIVIDDHSPAYVEQRSEVDATTSGGNQITTTDDFQGGSYVLGDGFKGCTQTSGSEQDVQPYTHCWAFVVPDGQTLAKVGVKVGGAVIDSSLVPTDEATWTIP